MTDLELTRLCAEAMGLKNESDLSGTRLLVGNEIGGYNRYIYDPLHDDAQALALVKKCKLWIDARQSGWTVAASSTKHDNPYSHNANLNRAICERCARMQLEKSK